MRIMNMCATGLKGVDKIPARYYMWQNRVISYKKEYGVFDLICVHPDYLDIENATMKEGRFINNIDIQKQKKSGCNRQTGSESPV